tara:strand:+ start:2943 stop:3542 length:600 start_codon:yes stop_codon:yes gene_type:complete
MKSIGDFAESLINEQVSNIREGTELPPSLADASRRAAPAGVDISTTVVPESMRQEILGESYIPKKEEEIQPFVIEEEVEESPPILLEERVDELVSLLKEVKEMLSEMMGTTTTTGMGGINFAPHQKEKTQCDDQKRGYIPSTKSNKAAKSFLTKLNKRTGIKRSVDDGRDPGENKPGVQDDLPKTRKEVFKNALKRYKK